MAMKLEEALSKLEAQGSEKIRAMYRKQGAGENTYGVKHGDVRKLAARIKKDHPLALALWKTGNYEARLLAVLILEPSELSRAELDRMVRGGGVAWIGDWLASYVIREHPEKESLRRAWMEDDDPWAARAGWSLTAGRVARSPEGLDLPALLDRIEAEMAAAPAPTQWTMNSCLATIGIHFPEHRKRALAIGERLGVYRDYPVSKGCTSPFAPIWIGEMVRRQQA
jgi:3-methyladenine DNA glycosylase AlkD